MSAQQVNFDGIVGPTHTYAGLSYGNVASMESRERMSNPREAALQGLEKMWFLADLGVCQAVIPPQERPSLPFLHSIGYEGSAADVCAKAYKETPELYLSCCSAAGMFAANAATVTPSSDTEDGYVQITAANLAGDFHRALESQQTSTFLKKIFASPTFFHHHEPLEGGASFGDEGSANQIRFCKEYHDPGVHLFVYGKHAFGQNILAPHRYPARQTLEAAQALARRHKIFPKQCLFLQQEPAAIDAGVFHNDVISMGAKNVFIYHEKAFVSGETMVKQLKEVVEEWCDVELLSLMVPTNRLSLDDAVQSYLFNSQIVTLADGRMALIAPEECSQNVRIKNFIDQEIVGGKLPIGEVHYVDLSQSMANGGGAACLRLPVILTAAELQSISPGIILTEKLYRKLKAWINKHYRSELLLKDLADPLFIQEVMTALDDLTQILELGSFYSFQKNSG